MNIPLKALLTIGLLVSANYSAIADEAASAVPALQSIVERMKEMTPRQLAEEQKTLYETMQKMTPEERESTRNVMLDEWGKMTSEERNSLHDKGRSDEEKLLDREHLEHQNEHQRKCYQPNFETTGCAQ
ncbi:MAG: hypothetical protein HOO95_00500 [Gallionella sp.]|nr:hypothetical protein [Gallionella sp.]